MQLLHLLGQFVGGPTTHGNAQGHEFSHINPSGRRENPLAAATSTADRSDKAPPRVSTANNTHATSNSFMRTMLRVC
jgi:hypothetical protein